MTISRAWRIRPTPASMLAIFVPLSAAASVLIAGACGYQSGVPSPAGQWRAVLESPGGELPFGLRIEEQGAGKLIAVAVNGDEVLPFDTARIDGDRIVLRFDHYDSEISATISGDGARISGTWVKQAGADRPSMKFEATRGPAPRFAEGGHGEDGEDRQEGAEAPAANGTPAGIDGMWDAVFTDSDGDSPARGEFRLDGSRLLGTFLTPTGDYRFLEGDFHGGLLRLSCFDGGHAFLFKARMNDDATLSGDFWSRGSYHATWKAKRAASANGASSSNLPDSFAVTRLKNPSGHLRFSFPDVTGRPVSLSDSRFAGKVVLVDIFGSWCPNCNDQAPVLMDLYRTYHDRGLEMVGLAYEMTGDRTRDGVFVKKYADRYGIPYPLLLAGTSDKAEASLTLPDLSGVLAFPTLIFIGRDGKVAAIHTGFEGPGTGRHFDELRARYVHLIDSLI